MVTVTCLLCEKQFQTLAKYVKRGDGKYCSRECCGLAKTAGRVPKKKNFVCDECGVAFFRAKKSTSKHGLAFCSRKCKEKAQAFGGKHPEIRPPHYGSGVSPYSYRKAVDLSSCMRCGYNEHTEILQVHHRDRDRTNNLQENLEVLCPNCHLWEHYTSKDGLYNNRK
jgi:5-methylcytosine-specific restriction endonuclease McrA